MKEIIWLGDSLKQLKQFPEEVTDQIGYSLYVVQNGLLPSSVKFLKGFKPHVMELVLDQEGNAYRAVYTIKIGKVVYVLHCFQKKSKRGSETPKEILQVIRERLKQAEQMEKRGKENV